jgi:NAD(P)-dependent dehydrogenase (short-subunit alcohol dehydrogenase family)
MTMERDMFSLEGKVALVTGASGALGRDISMALAGAGADVIIVGRNADRLRETARVVEGKGRKSHTIIADLSKSEDIARIIQESIDQFQCVDILVNNAATNVFKKAEKFTEEDFDLIFTTNVKGPFSLSRQLSGIMKTKGGGNIVFVVSQLGQTAMNFACLYGATKAALMQITRSLAFEWAEYNIRVNSVSPGPWSTGMLEPVFKDGVTEEALIRMTPSGRLGGEGDIGGAVIFLVSDAARHITGQDLIVDGGFSICKIV